MPSVDIRFPGNLAQVASAADLRAIPSYMVDASALYVATELGRAYSFDTGSLAPDDGVSVIKPNDRTSLQAGRWVYEIEGFAPGAAGPSNNTRLTLDDLKSAKVTDKTSLYSDSLWTWTLGDFTGKADDATIVESNLAPLTTGAWVRTTPATGAPGALINGGVIDVLYAQTVGGIATGPVRAVVQSFDDAIIGSNNVMPNPTFSGSPATGWTVANFTANNPGVSHATGTIASAKRTIAVEAETSYRLVFAIDTTAAGGVTAAFDGEGILGNVDYFKLPIGSDFQLVLPYISSAAGNIEFEFRTDAVWAGKLKGFSLIKVAREAPFSHATLSSDNKSFARPVGIKAARNYSGVFGVGDRATNGMLTSSAAWDVSVGARAGSVMTDQIETTLIGALCGEYNVGSRCTGLGYSAGRLNQGQFNTFLAFKALGHNTTGSRNTATGAFALFQVAIGNDNTGEGYNALLNAEGSFNTAVGSGAGQQIGAVGDGNTYVGANSGPYTPDSNVHFNYANQLCVAAGAQAYGPNCVSIGFSARVGTDPNTGGTAIGTSAVAIGYGAIANADQAVVVGGNAAVATTTSVRSTVIGDSAQGLGEQCLTAGFLAESRMFSVAVGSQAGRSSLGVRCVFVGVSAGNENGSPKTFDDCVAIGFDTHPTKAGQVIIGGAATVETVLRGVIRTNTTYTVATLPAAGSMGAGARAFVTDASAATFASAVAGGGANGVPVYSDGAAWRVG